MDKAHCISVWLCTTHLSPVLVLALANCGKTMMGCAAFPNEVNLQHLLQIWSIVPFLSIRFLLPLLSVLPTQRSSSLLNDVVVNVRLKEGEREGWKEGSRGGKPRGVGEQAEGEIASKIPHVAGGRTFSSLAEVEDDSQYFLSLLTNSGYWNEWSYQNDGSSTGVCVHLSSPGNDGLCQKMFWEI